MITLNDYRSKIFLGQYPRPKTLDEEQKILAVKYLSEILKEKNKRFIGNETEERATLRANIVMSFPADFNEEFWRIQDSLLWTETLEKGIVDCNQLDYCHDIALWQGDITRLNADAIVNAANKEMLGCFAPDHLCIDNVIQAAGGLQIRRDCDIIMKLQGHLEPTGAAKITSAYNLPSKYILHTVGPIVYGNVTENENMLLQSCYISCLNLAKEMQLKTIAFCCISTGVFRYPNKLAYNAVMNAIKQWRDENAWYGLKIIFNVFLDKDKAIYEKQLGIKAQRS